MRDFIENVLFVCLFIVAVALWPAGFLLGIAAMSNMVNTSPWMWLAVAGWFVIYPAVATSIAMYFSEKDEAAFVRAAAERLRGDVHDLSELNDPAPDTKGQP